MAHFFGSDTRPIMRFMTYGVAVLSLWQSGSAASVGGGSNVMKRVVDPELRVRAPERVDNILEPILPSEMGLRRRDGPSVGLANDTSMFWGKAGDAENVMVNLTLATGESQMILSMDHFKEELQDVDCDGSLVLTFKSEATYQDAIDDWEWVNFNEQRTFVMIVNYGDCSPESGRQPWVVSAASYDNAKFKVHFTAVQTQWYNLTNPYEITWGSYTPATDSLLAARWNPIDTIKGILNPSWSPKFDINLAHTIPSTLWEKSTSSGLDLSIGCDSCGTTGKLTIAGKIKGSLLHASIDEAYVEATPSNIGADFNPSFTVSGELSSKWDKSWEIVRVPLSTFSIPLVFSVGPELRLSAGFELSAVQGSATVKAGISARIPDSASAKVDFHGSDTHVDGWKPVVTTKPISLEAEVQGKLAIYTAIGVDIGMTIFKVIDMGVGLELQVPKVTMTLGAEFNSQGNVCPNRPEMFGVKFDASIGVDLSILAWNADKDKPFFSKDLWNEPALYSFPQVCLPFKDGPTSPIDMTKSVSVAAPTPTPTPTTSEEPSAQSTTSEEPSTTEPSDPSTTQEPATTDSRQPSSTEETTTTENTKPPSIEESTSIPQATTSEQSSPLTTEAATTSEVSDSTTSVKTTISSTANGNTTSLPTGFSTTNTSSTVDYTPVFSTLSHGTTPSSNPTAPIYSNSTGIWTSQPAVPTVYPIIDPLPAPTTIIATPIINPPPSPTGGASTPGSINTPTNIGVSGNIGNQDSTKPEDTFIPGNTPGNSPSNTPSHAYTPDDPVKIPDNKPGSVSPLTGTEVHLDTNAAHQGPSENYGPHNGLAVTTVTYYGPKPTTIATNPEVISPAQPNPPNTNPLDTNSPPANLPPSPPFNPSPPKVATIHPTLTTPPTYPTFPPHGKPPGNYNSTTHTFTSLPVFNLTSTVSAPSEPTTTLTYGEAPVVKGRLARFAGGK